MLRLFELDHALRSFAKMTPVEETSAKENKNKKTAFSCKSVKTWWDAPNTLLLLILLTGFINRDWPPQRDSPVLTGSTF